MFMFVVDIILKFQKNPLQFWSFFLCSSHVGSRSLSLGRNGWEIVAVSTIISIPIARLLVDAILLMAQVDVDISHHYIISSFLADSFHFHRRLVQPSVLLLDLSGFDKGSRSKVFVQILT